MDKKYGVSIQENIIQNEKEGNPGVCNNMDGL